MHEKEKLKEASYFLGRMEATVDDPEAFQHELSAFLSSARSVLQYAHEEATKKQASRQWYETQVSGNAVLKFFKSKRDLNVHTEPVRPSRHIAVSETAHVSISESIRIEIQRADGTTEVRELKEEPPKPIPQETNAEVTVRYVFSDWVGADDVMGLSHQYFMALEKFVNAGISSGNISG